MSTYCQPSTCDGNRAALPRPAPGRCRGTEAPAAGAPAPPAGPLPIDRFRELAEAPAELFKQHRTGDVARVAARHAPCGVAAIRKRFWYPRLGDRLRGVLRTTALARSRVEGEAQALERFARLGLQPPLLLAWGEARRGPFLSDSYIYLREVDSEPLDRWFAEQHEPEARAVTLATLARFVAALQRASIVDRDLHLRNLLRTRAGELVKIDSPFARVVPAPFRRRGQRLDRADLERDLVRCLAPDEFARWQREWSTASSAR